jgi:hypothetical protein
MGCKQLGFSDYELTTAKKQTKSEKFLSEMEAVVPLADADRLDPTSLPQNEHERRPASVSARGDAAHPPRKPYELI